MLHNKIPYLVLKGIYMKKNLLLFVLSVLVITPLTTCAVHKKISHPTTRLQAKKKATLKIKSKDSSKPTPPGKITKVRESTRMEGNFLVSVYKFIKQQGANSFEIPDLAHVTIETIDRIGRGHVTVSFDFRTGYKVGNVVQVSIPKDHKAVLLTLHNYIKAHFGSPRLIWHISPTDFILYNECIDLNIETVLD